MTPTRFVVASAVSRTRSRTGPSHCTPRRYIGVEGETRQPPSALAVWPQDHRQPSPWLHRPAPLNSRRSTSPGGFRGQRPADRAQRWVNPSYGLPKSSQVPVNLRLTSLELFEMWTAKSRLHNDVTGLSTPLWRCVSTSQGEFGARPVRRRRRRRRRPRGEWLLPGLLLRLLPPLLLGLLLRLPPTARAPPRCSGTRSRPEPGGRARHLRRR